MSMPLPKREATPDDVLLHPLTCTAAVAFALTLGLRWLFFHFSERIWALREEVPIESITPWARWAMQDRDGAEPQVLLLLILILVALTTAAINLMGRVSAASRKFAAVSCLIGSEIFLAFEPLNPPVRQIDREWPHILVVVGGVLLVALAVQWAGRRPATYGLLLLLSIPVCFLTALPQSLSPDLAAILAPALRLRSGFPLHDIYFQYDLFPSLIAMGWRWLGADPAMFSFCTRTSYFLLLAGCFFLARRLFADPRLASLLLVALCAVRVYGGIYEANASPQVTPLRVDLWILLLAAALHFGLEHWVVGLTTALVFFFLRGFGLLYVGSYALALTADFCARRAALPKPPALLEDIAASLRRVMPSLVLVVAGIAAARLAFGSFIPDAVATYHRLGLGMMRIAPSSFYWWIAPGIAAAAALAFRSRQFLPEKRAQAALFALALAIGNSIYFFGRSHENNLINVSASLLLSFFLGVDLAAFTLDSKRARRLVLAVPWCALALIAFSYSGRLFARVGDQVAAVAQVPHPQETPQPIVCAEINAVVPDHRVFVFSINYDYWFYERCGYVPQGYIQPLWLQIFRRDVIAQMARLLDNGYKIVVPKMDTPTFDAEFAPGLNEMYRLESTNYIFYGRRP
jgi:hypothetical protein